MEKEFTLMSIAGSATVPFRGVNGKSPTSQRGASMNVLSKLYYRYKKILKVVRLFLIIAGPGIIVMVADNDAGGITTYTATGAKYGFHLIWFLILLGPVAYYVQEMTVRLGAVTKRGHAEAIFHVPLGMVLAAGPRPLKLAHDDH
jgi:hypothetical protein